MIIKFTNKCHIQTPWIKLNAYGVPRVSDYLTTDIERSFIKVPLEDNEFKYKLLEVDLLLVSEAFKQEHLGPDYDKYTYVPLVKTPDDRPPYVKFKLDVNLGFDEFTIKTQISKIWGEKVREVYKCSCINDVVKAVNFNSDIRMIITPVKLWIMKGTKTYGLTYKVN